MSRGRTKAKRSTRPRKAGAPPAVDALEASGLAWWVYDAMDGRVRLSGLWSEMLGGAHEPVIANADGLFALVPDEERAALMAVFQDTLKGKRDQCQFEHRVRTRSGGQLWVRASGRVLSRSADGKAVFVSVTGEPLFAADGERAASRRIPRALRAACRAAGRQVC